MSRRHPVVTPRAFLACGPWVPAGARPSLRPLFFSRAKRTARLGRLRREKAKSYLRVEICVGELRCRLPAPSLRGALATKQSRVPPRKDSGLLRYARNDDGEAVCSTSRSRAPDAAQRSLAMRCRAGAQNVAGTVRLSWPRLCAATLKGVAARPGYEVFCSALMIHGAPPPSSSCTAVEKYRTLLRTEEPGSS